MWVANADTRLASAWLLGGLGATDWIDGYLARRFQQVSAVGKVLDPLADRLMLVTAVVCMVIYELAPLWVLMLIVIREVLVSLAVVLLAARGAKRMDVSWLGKAGTFGLMFALPMFIGASASTGTAHRCFEIGAWIFTLGGLPLSYLAAAGYVPEARRALAETKTDTSS